jgi:hypothetical protein
LVYKIRLISRPEGQGCKGLLDFLEKRLKELLDETGEKYDFETLALGIICDYAYVLAPVAPKWAPGKIVSIFNDIICKISSVPTFRLEHNVTS